MNEQINLKCDDKFRGKFLRAELTNYGWVVNIPRFLF